MIEWWTVCSLVFIFLLIVFQVPTHTWSGKQVILVACLMGPIGWFCLAVYTLIVLWLKLWESLK